jgi:hypothetical protein
MLVRINKTYQQGWWEGQTSEASFSSRLDMQSTKRDEDQEDQEDGRLYSWPLSTASGNVALNQSWSSRIHSFQYIVLLAHEAVCLLSKHEVLPSRFAPRGQRVGCSIGD